MVGRLCAAVVGVACASGVALGGGDRVEELARGVVYHDANANGARDDGERGIAGVRVSNGRDVVVTGEDGSYEIGVWDDGSVFVIKPSGWGVPLSDRMLPRFAYVHRPEGSPPGLRYAGLGPTGPLPASIDFALARVAEPDRFGVVVLGDPQPRNLAEVEYFAHDVLEDVLGSGLADDARFVISLGDIAFDNLSVYGPYNAYMSLLGMPVHNVHGNHDLNFDVESDALSDETWQRVYGPGTYAFDFGPAHFIIVDNVVYEGESSDRRYHGDLTDEQLAFIENDLAHVPHDTLVVVAMHIPLTDVRRRGELLALLAPYERTLSLSAHWHVQRHYFLGSEDGWPGEGAHHHVVHATGSGSWWSGMPDERGIPHTTMRDGQPNGWSLLTVDGSSYSLRFKAAGRPASEQMAIHAPSVVDAGRTGEVEVVANVWGSSERSRVEVRVGGGRWERMRRTPMVDPGYAALKRLEELFPKRPGRDLPDAVESQTTWSWTLPAGLGAGVYEIEVRHTDVFGQRWHGRRMLRVR